MSKPKPEPVKAPFQQQQSQTNTYGRVSIADSPEAQALSSVPLNFGDSYAGLSTDVDVDPGVARRTALARQSAENRADSAFNFGVPRFIREANREKQLRDIDTEGAYQAQQAQYAQQMGKRELEYRKSGMVEDANRTKVLTELERRRQLLPQVVQTGGSGSSSGYNTQVMQPQGGGFLSSFGQGLGAGLGGALPFI
jgi:hypothetical protein